MQTSELEELLEGQTETQSLEFKGSCAWEARTFAKDILAMANVRDGGWIVVGVEDGTYKRQGLSEVQIRTFDQETMQDQMAEYADPFVSIQVFTPDDKEGRHYVVIKVRPFDDVPVICKKDGLDLQQGAVYYRGKSRRPESARIRNSYDVRDLIELATVRMMRRKTEIGFTVIPSDKQKLDSELQGL